MVEEIMAIRDTGKPEWENRTGNWGAEELVGYSLEL